MPIALNRVLIVEDELIVREHLKTIMVDLGAQEVLLASRGSEAINKAQGQNLDLVLMDIVLPGDMDGIEAAGIIQDFAEVPVIFLTAFQDSQHIYRAAQRHLRAFMNKPISDSQLKSTVHFTLTAAKKRQKAKLSLSSPSINLISRNLQKQAESEASLFQQFFESLPTAAAIISRLGTIIRVNPSLGVMYGVDAAELVGQNIGTLVDQTPDPKGIIFGEWFKSADEETSHQKNLSARLSHGQRCPIKLTMVSSQYQGEDLWFCTLTELDKSLTHQTQVENWSESLDLSDEFFRNAQPDVKNLILSFAHEIRNPLTVAMGFSHKIKEETNGDVLLSAEMVTSALSRISDFLKRATQTGEIEATLSGDTTKLKVD